MNFPFKRDFLLSQVLHVSLLKYLLCHLSFPVDGGPISDYLREQDSESQEQNCEPPQEQNCEPPREQNCEPPREQDSESREQDCESREQDNKPQQV